MQSIISMLNCLWNENRFPHVCMLYTIDTRSKIAIVYDNIMFLLRICTVWKNNIILISKCTEHMSVYNILFYIFYITIFPRYQKDMEGIF